MRAGCLLALLLLCAQEGFALKRPDAANDPGDREALRQMDQELADGRNAAAEVDYYRALLRQENSGIDRDPGRIADLERQIAEGEKLRDLRYGKVVRLLVGLYDLKPVPSSGTILVPGSCQGRKAVWTVVAQESRSRWIVGEDGTPVKHVVPASSSGKRTEGVTYNDGISFIDPMAFTRSPGYLAATIYHESIHFHQNTVPEAARLSQDEQETAAYMAAYYAKETFGLTDAEALSFLAMAREKSPDGGQSERAAEPAVAGMARPADAAGTGSQAIREREASVAGWWRRLIAEAGRCGFRPVDLSRGIFSFEGNNSLRLRLHGDIEVMKARFLFARVCMNTTFRDLEPCNDSLGLVAREWSNRAFRYGITSPEPSVANNCLIHVADKLKRPREIRSLTDVADRFWKEWTDAESDARRSMGSSQLQPAPYESPPREKQDYRDCLAGNCVDLPSRISVPGLSY